MLTTLKNIYTHYRLFGVGGIQFLFQKKRNKNGIVQIKLKGYTAPIHLRNNTSDVPMFYHIFKNREYDIDFPFSPKSILDLGAHVGLGALFFAHKFPDAKIYCLEPEEENFKILKKNTAHNNNISCLQGGVWNRTTHLKIIDPGLGNWGFMTEEVEEAGADTIKAYSLEDLMIQFNLTEIDICKINIEGTEKELFEKNYDSWLSRTKAIIIELHDRMREGCSKSFFTAINHYRYSLSQSWSYLVCLFRHD